MRLESVTVHVPGRDAVVWGMPHGHPVEVPLGHRGEHVGDLVVTLPGGESLGARGQRTLTDLATVVATAVAVTRAAEEVEETRRPARPRPARGASRHPARDPRRPRAVARRAPARAPGRPQPPRDRPGGRRRAAGHPPGRARPAGLRRPHPLAQPAAARARRAGPVGGARRALGQARRGRPRRCGSTSTTTTCSDPQVAAAAYGIAAEAVVNVARHSRGEVVHRRRPRRGADGLRVAVHDDGRGIDATARPGVGSSAMRERAEEQGGRVDVRSEPGPRHDGRGRAAGRGRDAVPEPIRVALVDDHPVFRLGMAGLLARCPASPSSARPPTPREALALAAGRRRRRPHGPPPRRGLGHRDDPRARAPRPRRPGARRDDARGRRLGRRVHARRAPAATCSRAPTPDEVERAVRAVANGEVILGPAVAARAVAALTTGRTVGAGAVPRAHRPRARGARPRRARATTTSRSRAGSCSARRRCATRLQRPHQARRSATGLGRDRARPRGRAGHRLRSVGWVTSGASRREPSCSADVRARRGVRRPRRWRSATGRRRGRRGGALGRRLARERCSAGLRRAMTRRGARSTGTPRPQAKSTYRLVHRALLLRERVAGHLYDFDMAGGQLRGETRDRRETGGSGGRAPDRVRARGRSLCRSRSPRRGGAGGAGARSRGCAGGWGRWTWRR